MPARPTPQEKAETLAWLRRISGDLATATIKRLEESLPWYADMPPARRSAVGLVAQAGIASFIQWYDDPGSTPWIAADIFAAAPRDRILIETDAPFLAPPPHRGKRNEPAYVAHTARVGAELFGMSQADFAALTSANFDRLFFKAAAERA